VQNVEAGRSSTAGRSRTWRTQQLRLADLLALKVAEYVVTKRFGSEMGRKLFDIKCPSRASSVGGRHRLLDSRPELHAAWR